MKLSKGFSFFTRFTKMSLSIHAAHATRPLSIPSISVVPSISAVSAVPFKKDKTVHAVHAQQEARQAQTQVLLGLADDNQMLQRNLEELQRKFEEQLRHTEQLQIQLETARSAEALLSLAEPQGPQGPQVNREAQKEDRQLEDREDHQQEDLQLEIVIPLDDEDSLFSAESSKNAKNANKVVQKRGREHANANAQDDDDVQDDVQDDVVKKAKRWTQAEMFCSLANPDVAGRSRWVERDEFVDEYISLALGNGGSWFRKGSKLEKTYVIELDRTITPGTRVDRIRLNGFKNANV